MWCSGQNLAAAEVMADVRGPWLRVRCTNDGVASAGAPEAAFTQPF
jgi:hypothetical protein